MKSLLKHVLWYHVTLMLIDHKTVYVNSTFINYLIWFLFIFCNSRPVLDAYFV